MLKTALKSLLVLVLLPLLIACQSGSGKSAESTTTPTQESAKKIGGPTEGGLFSSVFDRSSPKTIALPPDLIARANDKVQENHNKAELEASQKVLPEVVGAKVIQSGEQRWLRVESDPEEVWDTLVNFWAAERIELVEFKPAAGLMETDWIGTSADAREKKGIFATMFNRIVGRGTAFDKFKIRLEREAESVTNIYVTHRATAKQESNYSSGQKVIEWDWVEGESDSEKVAQLLQVMVLLFESPEARLNTSA